MGEYGKLNVLLSALERSESFPSSRVSLDSGEPLPMCVRLGEAHLRLLKESRQRLGAAVHELKTPLGVIAGYAELLLSGKVGPVNRQQWRILEDMNLHCQRLARVISDLLAYSSLETGMLEIKPMVADLNACLSELYKLWLPEFERKGIALYFRRSDDLQVLRFDYDKIQHVVTNLLENGLKFTPKGGTVWLEAESRFWERRKISGGHMPERRRAQKPDQPNAVRVSVCDTGPGIDPEHHREIFEPFVRLEKTAQAPQSMGLGLAVAQLLVQAHGGKMWVESKLGSGSRFCVLLPRNTDAPVGEYDVASSGQDSSG